MRVGLAVGQRAVRSGVQYAQARKQAAGKGPSLINVRSNGRPRQGRELRRLGAGAVEGLLHMFT